MVARDIKINYVKETTETTEPMWDMMPLENFKISNPYYYPLLMEMLEEDSLIDIGQFTVELSVWERFKMWLRIIFVKYEWSR